MIGDRTIDDIWIITEQSHEDGLRVVLMGYHETKRGTTSTRTEVRLTEHVLAKLAVLRDKHEAAKANIARVKAAATRKANREKKRKLKG